MSYVILKPSDGTEMHAYIAMPKGEGPFPGIIVYQEAFGVNGHIRSVADHFAAEGYVAIAPELFHRTAAPYFEGNYTDFAAIAPHFHGMSDKGLEADIFSVWDWLQAQPNVRKDQITSTGYCLGGRVSFYTNTLLPLKAAVSYYGGRIAPDLIRRADKLYAPMLFFWGGLDKHILPDQIDAVISGLKEVNKPYTNVVISTADHGFFCEARTSYNPQAANEAWALTLAFLKMKIAAPGI
jgi:carboxymethylenebutenolidase